MGKSNFYVYDLSESDWEKAGFVDAIHTSQNKNEGVYDKNGNVIMDAEPLKIRDELIHPSLESEIQIGYGDKPLKCAANHTCNYTLVLKTSLSNYYVSVTGESPYDLSYEMHHLGLVQYQNIGVVEKYLETIIRMTRLANKEVE